MSPAEEVSIGHSRPLLLRVLVWRVSVTMAIAACRRILAQPNLAVTRRIIARAARISRAVLIRGPQCDLVLLGVRLAADKAARTLRSSPAIAGLSAATSAVKAADACGAGMVRQLSAARRPGGTWTRRWAPADHLPPADWCPEVAASRETAGDAAAIACGISPTRGWPG